MDWKLNKFEEWKEDLENHQMKVLEATDDSVLIDVTNVVNAFNELKREDN